MNIFNSIKTIVVGIILTITSFFSSTDKIVTDKQQTIIPTIVSTAIETRTIVPSPTLTLQIIGSVITSPSATPTPSEETINKCNQLSHKRQYFDGLKCYPEEYQQYLKDKKIDSINGTDEMLRVELPFIINTNTKDLLTNNCIKIGPPAYEHCNGSLEVNADRFKKQILEKYALELKDCLSKIAEGDNKNKDITKDLFWKTKMKEKMDELYLYCSQNNENFDRYNF